MLKIFKDRQMNKWPSQNNEGIGKAFNMLASRNKILASRNKISKYSNKNYVINHMRRKTEFLINFHEHACKKNGDLRVFVNLQLTCPQIYNNVIKCGFIMFSIKDHIAHHIPVVVDMTYLRNF